MKNFNMLLIVLIAVISFQCGTTKSTTKSESDNIFDKPFVGNETPGTLTATGDAGSPNVFTFNKWGFTEVRIPEGNVEKIYAEILIYTGSATTGYKELEKNILKKKDYFYVDMFPKASVVIDGATANADGSYTTEAELTLKGISNPITLNFTISDSKPYKVEGEGVIIRQNWGFTGGGPKNEVPVSLDAELPL
ncbi:MAG: YceI family protein [Bacteroidota bacterium]